MLTFINDVSAYIAPLLSILAPFALGGLVYLANLAVGELQKRGMSNAYVAALPRAVGAGVASAQAKGLSIFSAAGEAEIARVGAAYMLNTVGGTAKALGIGTVADQATRVLAQLGTLKAQAEADAATTNGAAAPTTTGTSASDKAKADAMAAVQSAQAALAALLAGAPTTVPVAAAPFVAAAAPVADVAAAIGAPVPVNLVGDPAPKLLP